MGYEMKNYSKMKRSVPLDSEQKWSITLLSIGTFLEYFDLMLYIHMAVLLNELFFPKTDAFTASLISAFAFCSTYMLRPFGSLLFGWIGDTIGRKRTIIITTLLMSCSCFMMALLPTYAQIGIVASWLVTICRIVQGLSSMGERIGAEIYLTETIRPPMQYKAVSYVELFSALGSLSALAVANISIIWGVNWRYAFFLGATVALAGYVARTRLRETPDFLHAKVFDEIVKTVPDVVLMVAEKFKNKVNYKTSIALFFIQCTTPVCMYYNYIYSGILLKQKFAYTSEQVISHNFYVLVVAVLSRIFISYIADKIYPLRILVVLCMLTIIFILLLPFFLDHLTSPSQLFFIQAFYAFFGVQVSPGTAIFIKYFPVLKRYTYTGFIYALARALMTIIASFGSIYIIGYTGIKGIWIIMLPVYIGYAYGLRHFWLLEKDYYENVHFCEEDEEELKKRREAIKKAKYSDKGAAARLAEELAKRGIKDEDEQNRAV